MSSSWKNGKDSNRVELENEREKRGGGKQLITIRKRIERGERQLIAFSGFELVRAIIRMIGLKKLI